MKEADKFLGKKATYTTFVKLMGKNFKDMRVMSKLTIPTVWNATNIDVLLQRLPTDAGLVDMFKTHSMSKEQVQRKSELVWGNSDFNATNYYHAIFCVPPIYDNTFNTARNRDKLKHVMMGKKMMWNSLTSEFLVDIIGSKEEFKIESD